LIAVGYAQGEGKIQCPAATDVQTRTAEVDEEGLDGAACLFECVSQDRQFAKSLILVELARKSGNEIVIPTQPVSIERDRLKRVAEDVAEKIALRLFRLR
jgi:hypothetical protein